ncbi:unnamed protein product [Arabis nemorensis]|uniref:Uncharacterized protein n=1 Tax=Arabis nemorensis TaxID=586526 RepID=A0A565C5J4_9BRAS|nr:unnamed protein product [Arabis nemorensis]
MPSSSRHDDIEDEFFDLQPASHTSVPLIMVSVDQLDSGDTTPNIDGLSSNSSPSPLTTSPTHVTQDDVISSRTPDSPSLSPIIDTSSSSSSSLHTPQVELVTWNHWAKDVVLELVL